MVFSILQNKNTEIVGARSLLQTTLEKLQQFRNNDGYFENIFEKLDYDELQSKRRKGADIPDKRQQLRQIFFEILDIIITQIQVRFQDIGKLHFF